MPDIFVEHHPTQQPVHREMPTTQAGVIHPVERRAIRHGRLSIFSSFVRDPLGVALAEQHEDEHILLFIRRAFVTNIPWIFLTLALLLAPVIFPLLLEPLHLPAHLIGGGVTAVFIIFYYLVILGFAFTHFLTWFYDIGIVTEKRAVDIDFYNISFVSVATARAQDLKDVRYAQKGFFESLFDYGDVTMVVEASGEVLTFENTPHPAEVVSMLSVLIGGHQE